jgi:hypothetical protein
MVRPLERSHFPSEYSGEGDHLYHNTDRGIWVLKRYRETRHCSDGSDLPIRSKGFGFIKDV